MPYRYDLHVHTNASPCSRMKPEDLVETAIKRNLDGVAVTDHDTMENVSLVEKYAENKDLEVIPGVEVTCDEGHILAWVVENVPDSSNALEVIENVNEQGGYTCLAHPQDSLRQKFEQKEIFEKADFIETKNSRVLLPWMNCRAAEKASKYNKPATGGSDAHFPFEIGRALTKTEISIEKALEQASTVPCGRGTYVSGHVFTKVEKLIRS